jgi:hypothetical protein
MVGMAKPKAIVLDLDGTTMSSKYFGTGYSPYIKKYNISNIISKICQSINEFILFPFLLNNKEFKNNIN